MIFVSRPDDMELQNVEYDGHKRKHALKLQAIIFPEGLFFHKFRRINDGSVNHSRMDVQEGKIVLEKYGFEEEILYITESGWCIV